MYCNALHSITEAWYEIIYGLDDSKYWTCIKLYEHRKAVNVRYVYWKHKIFYTRYRLMRERVYSSQHPTASDLYFHS